MALTKVTSGGMDGTFPDDSIVNADIKTSAAIALSKLATDPSNASNLASGTVPTARLGSGTASSSVFLAGDNTWAAAGGGKILQIVQGTLSTETTTTSTSLVDTGLTVNIVPQTGSDVLILAYLQNCRKNAATGAYGQAALLRGASNIWAMANGYAYHSSNADTLDIGTVGGAFLDTSPGGDGSTTITYKVQAKNYDSSGNVGWSVNNSTSTITCIEYDTS